MLHSMRQRPRANEQGTGSLQMLEAGLVKVFTVMLSRHSIYSRRDQDERKFLCYAKNHLANTGVDGIQIRAIIVV